MNYNKWLQLISSPDICDPLSRKAKEFRTKFNVPFEIFNNVLGLCKSLDGPEERELPHYKVCDAAGRTSVPLELKILSFSECWVKDFLLKTDPKYQVIRQQQLVRGF